MASVWFTVTALVLIFVFMVVISLAISYQVANDNCIHHPQPWCFNDWQCNVPPATPDGLKETAFLIRKGILTSADAPGTSYNLKTRIFDPFQASCSTRSPDVTHVNVYTGAKCGPSATPPVAADAQCKTIPTGCITLDADGNIASLAQVWAGADGTT